MRHRRREACPKCFQHCGFKTVNKAEGIIRCRGCGALCAADNKEVDASKAK